MKKILLLLLFTLSLFAKPVYNVAIVTDGKIAFKSELEQALKAEIAQLLGRDFSVRFPSSMYRNGNWDYVKIGKDIDAMLYNPKCNIVITLGVLSSHIGARKQWYKKPLIATAIIDPSMQGIPFKKGASGKHNMTYINGHISIKDDIETIKSLMDVTKLSVLMNATMLKKSPQVGAYIKKVFKQSNIKVQLIPVSQKLNESLKDIDLDSDLVYVTPLFHLDMSKRRQLYDILRSKELPTYSSLGKDDVELGAMYGNIPSSDAMRMIRHVALEIQQISFGEKASRMFVNYKPEKALFLNMRTANDVNYVPSWDVLSKATILEQDVSDSYYFSIDDIMARAISNNLKIMQKDQQLIVDQEQTNIADSALFPQVNIEFGAKQIDGDRSSASLGILKRSDVSAKMGVSQVLFDQEKFAKVEINDEYFKASSEQLRYIKMDIALQSAYHYLRIMQLKSKLSIQKNNLDLSKNNLRSAKARSEIGVGSVSDIYRWESKIAIDKRAVIQIHAEIQQERYHLNSMLNLPQDMRMNFQDIDMSNPIFMSHHSELIHYFQNPRKFFLFENYLVDKGLMNAPELSRFKALVEARKMLVQASKASFYAPKVDVRGGVGYSFVDNEEIAAIGIDDHISYSDPAYLIPNGFIEKQPLVAVDSSGSEVDIGNPDSVNWEVGIYATLPLYLGGARSANLEAVRATLSATQLQENDMKNGIEENIRTALYRTKTAYLSITLAHTSYVAANKNLKLIKDVYEQGNTDILHLLDAQNEVLKAANVENNTRFSFMLEQLQLQRHISQISFDMKDETWQEWYTALENYETQSESKEN